jgi:hypothetical protein
MSRSPGPPLEDPPQVPSPAEGDAAGRSAVRHTGDEGCLALPFSKRPERQAGGVTGLLARRLRCRPTDVMRAGVAAADVPRSAAAGTAVEPVRSDGSGPASGVAGDRGGVLAAGQVVKRAPFAPAKGKETGSPGHGRAAVLAIALRALRGCVWVKFEISARRNFGREDVAGSDRSSTKPISNGTNLRANSRSDRQAAERR